jgi:HEAT repeat protein
MNVTIHVVGFGVQPNEVAQLERLAQAGGGRFGLAETKTQLSDELRKVVQPIPEAAAIKLSPIETALVARFKDEDQTVRRTAADTLLKMKATATLPFLHQRVLQEEEYYAWRSAVLALIGLDDERATAALVEAMTADNQLQRQWAAEWVPKTSDRSESTKLTKADQTLVSLLTDAKPEIRLSAAKSLRQRTAVAASGDLYARIQVESEYYAWREALTALKSLASDRAVDAIVAALEVDDKNIRGWAADWAAEVSK